MLTCIFFKVLPLKALEVLAVETYNECFSKKRSYTTNNFMFFYLSNVVINVFK